jgi:phage major head subunit gpT-like protein
MRVDPASLKGLFDGFNTAFNKGLKEAVSHYATVAMKVPSTTAANNYAWLADLPGIREWIGDRHVHGLMASKYTVENRLFEQTLGVRRTQIEDDQYGIFGPLFEKMGADTARHPDTLIFSLLAQGFGTVCYDGQNFFDTDHPVGADNVASVSNMQAGAGPAWYLLDCSQPIKPLIWQERTAFEFAALTDKTDENVFWRDQYIYGVRGRSNSGFGLWQLAYASKADLTKVNYEAARKAMAELKKDNGKPLGVSGTHLVVPPALEGDGRRLLKAVLEAGATNEWAGSAELIVTPHLVG